MKLPNGSQAIIPIKKITGYCLNPDHPSGKHKARVFASALGITAQNPERLLELVRQAAKEGAVVYQGETSFGQSFKVDWQIEGYNQIVLRTLWEIKTGSNLPRLVSAFIK